MISYLNNKMIMIEENRTEKKELLTKMVNLASEKEIPNKRDFLEKVLDREKAGTTGIGRGIALPHAKCNSLNSVVLVIAISRKGVDFDTLDSQLSNIIVMIGAPKEKNTEYLYLLSKISNIFRDNKLRKEIINVKKEEEIFELLAGHLEE